MIEARHWHQARRLLVQARRLVHSPVAGGQRSVFRGSGLVFDEVRPYEPGDDWRRIDWNVTARFGHPYLKRFREEREMPWLLVVDASQSMEYSTQRITKREVVLEAAALACAMALAHGDRLGLILHSEQIEVALPPSRGSGAALRLLHRLLFHRPKGRSTAWEGALTLAKRWVPRQGLVLLCSDFLTPGATLPPLELGRRQQVVCVRVRDPREQALPDQGLVRLVDLERGGQHLVDLRAAARILAARRAEEETRWRQWLKQGQAKALELSTSDCAAERFLAFMRFHFSRRTGNTA